MSNLTPENPEEEIEREKILMLKQLERMKEEDKQILVQKKIEKEEKIKVK